MKSLILFALLLTASAPGQEQPTKHVILSLKSNLDTASVAEGFSKYCPNVVVDGERGEGRLYSGSGGEDSRSGWRFVQKVVFHALKKDGDVLMTTRPKSSIPKYKHHFQDVCKYINGHAAAK